MNKFHWNHLGVWLLIETPQLRRFECCKSRAGQKSVRKPSSPGNSETHPIWGLLNFVAAEAICNKVLCVKSPFINWEVPSRSLDSKMLPKHQDRGIEFSGWGYSSSDSGRLRTQPWATLLKLGLRRRSSKPLMSSGAKGVPALGIVSPTRGPPKGTGVLGREKQQGK